MLILAVQRLLKSRQNDEWSNHFTITKRKKLDLIMWYQPASERRPRHHSFTFSLGTEIKDIERGQRAGDAWIQRLHGKCARPLSHLKLLPTGARSTSQMQIRGNEFMSCSGWRNMKWFFVFLRIVMGKYYSQRQRINTAAAGLITVSWRDEKKSCSLNYKNYWRE